MLLLKCQFQVQMYGQVSTSPVKKSSNRPQKSQPQQIQSFDVCSLQVRPHHRVCSVLSAEFCVKLEGIVCIVQCAIVSVQFVVCILQCAMCSVNFLASIVKCVMFSVKFVVCNVQLSAHSEVCSVISQPNLIFHKRGYGRPSFNIQISLFIHM